MTPIELMLREAAADVAWPATPDLAPAVVLQIEAPPSPRVRPRRLPVRRPLAIALAVLLLLAATAAAIPAVRDWLGLSTVEIKRVPKPLPVVRGAKLGLGTRVSLAAARSKLGFRPVLPTALGAPTVYYDAFPPGGQLGLAYAGGIVVTEVQGNLAPYLAKFIPPGTQMEELVVAGSHAVWIHGAMHQYAYEDRTGQIRTDSVRTAGNVLLWRRGNLLVRIEGPRSKQQAVRIASTARAAP